MGDVSDLSGWLNLTQQAAEQIDPKSRVLAYWKESTRPDGRLFAETRKTIIQQGILTKNAYGSAMVSGDDTATILAAVTVFIGQPSSSSSSTTTNSPGQPETTGGAGDIVVTITDTTTAANTTDALAPLQSFLQRIFDECLDFEQLVIEPNRSAYRLSLQIQILQRNGNLTDACLTAAVAALLNTKLPIPASVTIHEGKVYLPERTTTTTTSSKNEDFAPLKMPIIPCSLTAGIWVLQPSQPLSWIVDPSKDEETAIQQLGNGKNNMATIVVNANNDDGDDNNVLAIDLNAAQPGTLGMTDLAMLIRMALARAKALLPVLTAPVATTE